MAREVCLDVVVVTDADVVVVVVVVVVEIKIQLTHLCQFVLLLYAERYGLCWPASSSVLHFND